MSVPSTNAVGSARHVEAACESIRHAISTIGDAEGDREQLREIAQAVGEMSLLVGYLPHLLRQLAAEAERVAFFDGLTNEDVTRGRGADTAVAAANALRELAGDLARLTTGRRSPVSDAQLALAQLTIDLPMRDASTGVADEPPLGLERRRQLGD